MPLVVPDAIEDDVLTSLLTSALTMRLYSNNYTPIGGSATANFTQVSGGGYAGKALTLANWSITSGLAVYNALQEWTFTGATDSPGTIYGYYVIRNSDSRLIWAERFPVANVPFTPIAGSVIRILPRLTCVSQF